MHTTTGQGIQISGECGDKGFALAGFHFRDIAFVQENPAHQLHVKGAKTQGASGPFAAVGKGLGQQVIKAFSTGETLFEGGGLGDQFVITQGFEFRLKRIDFFNQRTGRLYLAVIGCAKDLFGEISETEHVFSAWVKFDCDMPVARHPLPK